ncbi:diguanylate cyclase domain-containing protein [Nocardia sp. NPDC051570]|uniref:GGDEF domain-containing protein n=1 Tax=Nocardia sp. NPDC051570 TaxID=3364324 RepID=UPI0037B9C8A7
MTDGRAMFRTWWQDRVDYPWLIETLESNSGLVWLRATIAAAGTVMLLITMVSTLSPAGQTGVVGLTQAWLTAALAAAWTMRWWLLPWPREFESIVWVAAADIAVTANNVMVQDRLLGALGVGLLVVTGSYVTIFHGPRVLAAHVAWSLLSSVLLAILLVIGKPGHAAHGTGDIALGIVVVLIMLLVTAFVLPTVQFFHWLLHLNALSDPLTGLLNRRGLDRHLEQFFGSGGRGGVYAVTLDLDRFKTVNDTFGHSVGDQVLVRTADCLRAAAPPEARVARTGGEEFVVVGWLREVTIDAVAERLRAAIETMSDLPTTVTASVGAVVFTPFGNKKWHARSTHQSLLARSDSAMYCAKQLGGNAVVIDVPGGTTLAPAMSGAQRPIRTESSCGADESWQRRLELAHRRIRELAEENARLHHRLALVTEEPNGRSRLRRGT